jgi:hypothetical protein
MTARIDLRPLAAARLGRIIQMGLESPPRRRAETYCVDGVIGLELPNALGFKPMVVARELRAI